MRDALLVLCDLDGTLYEKGKLIPGAREAISTLRTCATLRFLTNTDSTPTVELVKRLRALGLGVHPEEVFTPVAAARQWLIGRRKAVFLTNRGVQAEIGEGLEVAESRGEADAVVVGDIRDSLSYRQLDIAFSALRGGATLLALQRGRYFRAPDGDHLDTGAIVAALEYAAETTAHTLGKPSGSFVDLALRSAGGQDKFLRTIVIGDDRSTDIRMAVENGLESIQVSTGKAKDQIGRRDLPEADHVFRSIVEAAEHIAKGMS